MAAIKIQITLAELENILGGSNPTEAQLILRQSVAAEYAKRYLGKAIDSEIVKQAAEAIQAGKESAAKGAAELVREAFMEHGISVPVGYSYRPAGATFTKTATDAIRAEVKKQYDEAFRQAVAEYCDSEENKARIAAEVERRVAAWNDEQIRVGVRVALAKALKGVAEVAG